LPRTPKNLTAARRIVRDVHEPDAVTAAVITLAVTLARLVDNAAAGAAPPYVLAKLAATYGDVLRTLSELVGPRADANFDRFLSGLMTPGAGGSDYGL